MSVADDFKRRLLDQLRALYPSDPLQVGLADAMLNARQEAEYGGLVAASSLYWVDDWLFLRPSTGRFDYLTWSSDWDAPICEAAARIGLPLAGVSLQKADETYPEDGERSQKRGQP